MAALADVLSRHRLRVTEDRFLELVEQALTEIGGPAADDPLAVLGSDEVDALLAVKADLTRRGSREPDPRAAAAASYAALLADALSVAEVAMQLGIDPSRVRHRLGEGRLLGIPRPRGWLLPAYQFGADGFPLPGLERVVPVLAPAHPLVAARFFATSAPELVADRRRLSPREWLEGGGDPARVASLARALDLLA